MFFSPPPREREPDRLPAQTDPEELRRRSLSRSRSSIRRYIVANGLTTLWTLTFAPSAASTACTEVPPGDDGDGWCGCGRPASRAAALSTVPAFVRSLRAGLWNGSARPYLVVAEPHKDGHWHLHMAAPGFMHWQRVAEAWGHGFVDARGKGRAIKGRTRTHARAVSGYVAKYLVKSFEVDCELDGQQRYRVAERFAPAVVERLVFHPDYDEGLNEALRVARRAVPGRVIHQWDSNELEDWTAPRTVLLVHGDVA